MSVEVKSVCCDQDNYYNNDDLDYEINDPSVDDNNKEEGIPLKYSAELIRLNKLINILSLEGKTFKYQFDKVRFGDDYDDIHLYINFVTKKPNSAEYAFEFRIYAWIPHSNPHYIFKMTELAQCSNEVKNLMYLPDSSVKINIPNIGDARLKVETWLNLESNKYKGETYSESLWCYKRNGEEVTKDKFNYQHFKSSKCRMFYCDEKKQAACKVSGGSIGFQAKKTSGSNSFSVIHLPVIPIH